MSTSTNLWRRRRGSRLGGIRTPVLVLSSAVQWVTVYLILALLLLLVAAAVGAERAEARPTCPPGHTYEQEVNGRHITEGCTPVGGGETLTPTEAWEKSGPLVPESANLQPPPPPAKGPISLPDDGERTVYLWDPVNGRWQHVDTVLANVERGTIITSYDDPVRYEWNGHNFTATGVGTGNRYDLKDQIYRVKVVTRYDGTKFYDVRPGHNPVSVTTTTTSPGRSRRSAPENAPPPPVTTTTAAPTVSTTTTTVATTPTTSAAPVPASPPSSDPCTNGDWLTCRATTEPKASDYPDTPEGREEHRRAVRCHWTWCPPE